MIPMPDNLILYNGGERCDMLVGPCACGAWHQEGPNTVYQAVWRDIVENPDGTLNLAQIKLELYDFFQAIQNVTKVYDVITNGKFTNINTDPQHIIDAAENYYEGIFSKK